MKHWWHVAAFAAVFVSAVVVGALVADAIDGDDAPTTPEPSIEAGTGEPLAVMAPIWVDVNPQSDASTSVPESIQDTTDSRSSGLLVIQPIGGTETPRPAGEDGPVELDEVDEIAQQASAEAGERPTVLEPGATKPVSWTITADRDLSRLRFVDPCANRTEGTCPFGIAAQVALSLEGDDLQMAGYAFRGEIGSIDPEVGDGCQPGFVAGDYNIRFLATAPVTIEFSYGTANTSRAFQQQTIAAPQPGQPEYERWVANVEADRIDGIEQSTAVRTCAVLDLEPGTFYTFTPAIGRTDDGRVVESGWMPVIDTRPSAGSLGRPPTSIVMRGGTDASVNVWQRSPDDGYRTVVWPINNSQPDAPSCGDVEEDLFFMRRWGMQHADLGLAVFAIIPRVETQPPRVYDPQWGWRQRFDLSLREGRPYTLCIWEARLGDQSFDQWEILQREQIEIVTPNLHPIAMTLIEAGVNDGSATRNIEVSVQPGGFCDHRAARHAKVELGQAGSISVDDTFCETLGLRPDPTAFVALYVDGNLADTLAIPLDAERGCGLNGPDAACSTPFSEYFDATTEIPGSCSTQCASVDTRIRVDYLASNGQGTDRWHAAVPGTFDAGSPEDDIGPAVDIFSLDLAPIPNRVDALLASFDLNRPSQFEIHAFAAGHNEACNGVASGSGEGRVDVVIDGLCADTLYGLGEINLTDTEGLTGRQQLGSEVRLTWTNGYASHLGASLRLHSVEDEAVATEYCRQMGVYYEAVGTGFVSDRCWEHLSVSLASQLSLGNALARPSETSFCFSDSNSVYNVYAPTLENRHLLDTVHGEDVPYDLYAILEIDPDCGAQIPSTALTYVLDHEFTIPLARLDDLGWSIFVEESGLLWEFDFSRTDRGIANRLDR